MASHGISKIQNIQTQLSCGKIVVSEFWDSEGVIHGDLSRDVKTYVLHYSNLPLNDVHQAIRKKTPEKLAFL
jgi:hypothetical protein